MSPFFSCVSSAATIASRLPSIFTCLTKSCVSPALRSTSSSASRAGNLFYCSARVKGHARWRTRSQAVSRIAAPIGWCARMPRQTLRPCSVTPISRYRPALGKPRRRRLHHRHQPTNAAVAQSVVPRRLEFRRTRVKSEICRNQVFKWGLNATIRLAAGHDERYGRSKCILRKRRDGLCNRKRSWRASHF